MKKRPALAQAAWMDYSSVLPRMMGIYFTFLPTTTRFKANTISSVRSKKPLSRFQLMPHLQCCKPGNCCFIFLPQLGHTLLLAPISLDPLELVQPQFPFQLLLGGEVGEILGGEDLALALRQGVFYNGVALVGAQDDADGRIVALVHQLSGVVIHIHLHLADVLVGQLPHLQVDQHEAFKDIVVEHQIDVEILAVQSEPFLPCHEGEAPSQLQQELLQMVDESLLQIAFKHMGVGLDLQKFHHIGILNDLLILRLRLCGLDLGGNCRLVLAGQQPLVIHSVDLPL